jgi:hypothetical protein
VGLRTEHSGSDAYISVALASFPELERILGWRVLRSENPLFRREPLARRIDDLGSSGSVLWEQYGTEAAPDSITLRQQPEAAAPPTPTSGAVRQQIGAFQLDVFHHYGIVEARFATGATEGDSPIIATVRGRNEVDLLSFVESLTLLGP